MRAVGLLLVLLLPSVGWANRYLDAGRRLYASLRFSEAIEQLEIARQVPTATQAERLEALDLLGRCLIAEGRREEAERAFTDLLTLDPGAELDRKLSPKILDVFDTVKARLYPEDYLVLRALPSPPGLVRLEMLDPWRRAERVVVHALNESGASTSWAQVAARREGGVWVASLPAAGDARVHWFAEAQDGRGEVVARLGERERPFVFAAVPGAALPSAGVSEDDAQGARRYGAWTAAGAAAIAAVAGTVMQVRANEATRQYEQAEWAVDRRALHGRAQRDARWAVGLYAGAGAAAATALILFTW